MLKKENGQTLYPVEPLSPLPRILIQNGRVIDPVNNIDDRLNIQITNGIITAVFADSPDPASFDRVIDAAGQWVTPGLVDIHVHLREPGREDRETIFTGTCAAAAGGFTAVACMPNTTPVLDEEAKIRYVVQRAGECPSRVYPIGAITKELAGDELAPFGEMIRAGARAVSDDGKAVAKSNLMRNALNYSKAFDIPVICHCEDADLVKGCHMNESAVSTRLGIHGMPSIAEDIIVNRDILLAEYTGARVHIAHISTAGSVRIVREAKKRGVKVTCETAPHYFILTDESIATYDTCKKMNPPLRTQADVDAIIQGLADGTIDIIASDHAPHVPEDKNVEFDAAAFGVIGLETSLAASLTALVEKEILLPADLVEKMSVVPSRILGIPGGTLSVGAVADVTIIDPRPQWVVNPEHFYSKSRNSAFIGMTFKGYATATITGGRVVYEHHSS